MASAMGMNPQGQQQAYNDAMQAMVMQQAAAAAAGQQFPFLQFPNMQQFPVAMAGQQPVAVGAVDANQQQQAPQQQEQQVTEPQQG